MNSPHIAGQRLSWAAQRYGARPALIHGERTLRFVEVDKHVLRDAHLQNNEHLKATE